MALDPKLTKFTTASPIIQSFAAREIAAGVMGVVFFGSDTEDNGTTTHSLSENPVYSANIVTEAGGTSGEEKILDIDFDITFNISRRLKGKVIANVPVIVGHEITANTGGNSYVIIKVRHVTIGGSESEIASNTKSLVKPITGTQDTSQFMFNVEVDVATEKHFASGETLRITVELWTDNQLVNGTLMGLMHDPKNRTLSGYSGGSDSGEFITSILSFDVPFLIDI